MQFNSASLHLHLGLCTVDDAGQENLGSVLRDLSKGAGKKRVLKPQPKLDGERLVTCSK